MKKVSISDIESLVNFEISEECKKAIIDYNLVYEDLSLPERDSVILSIINYLHGEVEFSGPHRLKQWERGWEHSLASFNNKNDIEQLKPDYFGKSSIVRWGGEFVRARTEGFDFKLLTIFVDSYLHKFVGSSYDNLIEFGCGSSYHLVRFGERNRNINLIGLDWAKASQDIISKIQLTGLNNRLTGHNFDFYSPSSDFNIPAESAIFTCDALEQVGANFKPFIDFLLVHKPKLCINFEPITELLNKDILVDKLSLMHTEKRKYLTGYLTYLEQLEHENKIEILIKRRLYCGSLYLEPHSVVIWKIK
jgi:hypothetical protein